MKQTILISTLCAILVHLIFMFPVITFVLLYLAMGYATCKLSNIVVEWDYTALEDLTMMFMFYLIPWVILPAMLFCEWEYFGPYFKEKYPNFKIPSFRNPVYFKSEE